VTGPEPASPASTTVTVIEFEPLPAPAAGSTFEISLRLTTVGGSPLADAGVGLTLNGDTSRTRTDAVGIATFHVRQPLEAGEYSVVAEYGGVPSLDVEGTTRSATLLVRPIEVTLQTVPPVAGIEIQIDGARLTTDANGEVSTRIDRPGDVTIEVPAGGPIDQKTRWEFRRWETGSAGLKRTLPVGQDATVQLGLEMQHLLTLGFLDLGGGVVEASRVDSVELKSTVGDVEVVRPSDLLWVRVNNISRAGSGLIASPVEYAVVKVVMSGTNVVNQGQQRIALLVDPRDHWDIELLLFGLTVNARDRLFGFPMGSTVELTYPDGHVEQRPLESGDATFTGLPRGEYDVRILGPTLGISQPVSVTRPQQVTIRVLSYLDVGVAIFALAAALVLPVGARVVRQRRTTHVAAVGAPERQS